MAAAAPAADVATPAPPAAPQQAAPVAVAPEWQGDYFKSRQVAARLESESLRSADKTVGLTVLRVAQLDADLLNREIWVQLRQQYRKCFAHLSAPYAWDLELDTLLALLLFRFTLWGHHQNYGDKLQNVIYRSEARAQALGRTREVLFSESVAPSRRDKLLMLLFSIFLPYVFQKLVRTSMDQDWGAAPANTAAGRWKRRLHAWLYPLENYFHILGFVNLLVFLHNGQYRSIVDRILGLRLVNYKSKVIKVWNFEFMDRQLWWTHLTEFLTFALPFINFLPRIRRMFRAVKGNALGPRLPDDVCAICNISPIQVEGVAPCGHRFCYYCISSRVTAAAGSASCPRCGEGITTVARPQPAPGGHSPRRGAGR
eukprot:TRINITY_DN835_c0_g1_i1.p1 TRINITY_DN835_c0_g1~~TRINITY_DN835_c0_g1_i1.p1  ORF type:complete len:393 (+),score=89.70 TRINITY_DN835_c0_g1_i1:71-1180(+)